MASLPTIVDLNAELAKLTMFRGLTPLTKRAERRGSATLLGPYRDGILFAGKNAGTSHWEERPEDELVHVLDGTKTPDVVCDDGPAKSFFVGAGMIAIVPQGAWHRFEAPDGVTLMTTTPQPTQHLTFAIDDPRTLDKAR